jgi:hypothetical protein
MLNERVLGLGKLDKGCHFPQVVGQQDLLYVVRQDMIPYQHLNIGFQPSFPNFFPIYQYLP